MAKTTLIAEPGKQEVVMTHIFDATPERVFQALTDPHLIPHWWGPRYLTTTVDRMEVKPGGLWRFIQRDDTGYEYVFHGVFHDILTPERLTYTFEFEGLPGHVMLEIVTCEPQAGGKTKLIDKSVYQSVDDRDGMFQSGLEEGATETMERLAELLVKDLKV